jgi:hypothetical protein
VTYFGFRQSIKDKKVYNAELSSASRRSESVRKPEARGLPADG